MCNGLKQHSSYKLVSVYF